MGGITCFWQYKALILIRKDRHKELAHVHAQHLIEAMAHNLYHNPGIIIFCT
ncbi:MAG: hypothetical protein ACMUEL_05625 [Flavobacteriales bacterium Tduv]